MKRRVQPFILSSLLVGLAQGVAASGAIKALLAAASAQQPAGQLSTIDLISNCGVALPALLAAHLAQRFDLVRIGDGYAAFGLAASIVAVAAMRTGLRLNVSTLQVGGETAVSVHGGTS